MANKYVTNILSKCINHTFVLSFKDIAKLNLKEQAILVLLRA